MRGGKIHLVTGGFSDQTPLVKESRLQGEGRVGAFPLVILQEKHPIKTFFFLKTAPCLPAARAPGLVLCATVCTLLGCSVAGLSLLNTELKVYPWSCRMLQ